MVDLLRRAMLRELRRAIRRRRSSFVFYARHVLCIGRVSWRMREWVYCRSVV
jgi:hypothetical protein